MRGLNCREFRFEVSFYALTADRGLYMCRQSCMESATTIRACCHTNATRGELLAGVRHQHSVPNPLRPHVFHGSGMTQETPFAA